MTPEKVTAGAKPRRSDRQRWMNALVVVWGWFYASSAMVAAATVWRSGVMAGVEWFLPLQFVLALAAAGVVILGMRFRRYRIDPISFVPSVVTVVGALVVLSLIATELATDPKAKTLPTGRSVFAAWL